MAREIAEGTDGLRGKIITIFTLDGKVVKGNFTDINNVYHI
jgi:hypothetical protein